MDFCMRAASSPMKIDETTDDDDDDDAVGATQTGANIRIRMRNPADLNWG